MVTDEKVVDIAIARDGRADWTEARGPAINITGANMYSLDTATGTLTAAGTGLGELSAFYTDPSADEGPDCRACDGYGVPAGQSYDGPSCTLCDGLGLQPSLSLAQ